MEAVPWMGYPWWGPLQAVLRRVSQGVPRSGSLEGVPCTMFRLLQGVLCRGSPGGSLVELVPCGFPWGSPRGGPSRGPVKLGTCSRSPVGGPQPLWSVHCGVSDGH